MLHQLLIYLFYFVLAVLALTTVVVVIRTILYQRSHGTVQKVDGVPVDEMQVAEHLAAAIRCKTVPLDDKGTPDPEAFTKLHRMLEDTYPLVHKQLRREVVNGYSLVYIWKGGIPELEPVMVMGHQDVVSAGDVTEWTYPPFDGCIENGFVWGRGTLDIKNQLIAIMEAAEALLQQGYRPDRTIVFGMGHDEETGGTGGSKLIGRMLADKGIHLAGIVDEGGGISAGLASGVRGPVALIGVSEKGYLTVEFKVHGTPGHSSTPPPQTAIGILAKALARLEAHPMPIHVRRMRSLYLGIGKAAPIYLQVAFSNVWLFGAILKRWLEASPEMNGSTRTTTALTIVRGGLEDNTVPPDASATVNFRLLPGDTIADVLWHAKKVINDDRVKATPIEGKFNEALPVSSSKNAAYRGLSRAIQQVFGAYPVAPFTMLGGTDCMHFVPVCDNIYRFTSLEMDESFRGLEHGIDERIPITGMAKMVKFYAQLMQVWGTREMA
ncbi:MAG TPA: M20/M25/M40 family metallo-hydrolase [Anaerolineales bacterium]|nr:M20/M25/M40 family metallo-hydrolase [Anaerolineales bacterium]